MGGRCGTGAVNPRMKGTSTVAISRSENGASPDASVSKGAPPSAPAGTGSA
jgi:hypothetical protein